MTLMVDNSKRVDFDRASRKAQEAALRRYEAVDWLQRVLGPLGIPAQPTETDFISCLTNGIILCNLINCIQPGTIPKVVVVDNHVPLQSLWDSTPLPAFQYFENVRNFLLALKRLNLPAFHASDLHMDNFEAGSAARIADSILALKSYHEWKQCSGGKGVYKHVTLKSPLSQPFNTKAAQPCRPLHISAMDNTKSLTESIVKLLSGHMVDSKENLNTNFLTNLHNGNKDSVQMFHEILSSCLEEKLRNKSPAVNLQETSGKESASYPRQKSVRQEKSLIRNNSKSRKGSSYLRRILQSREKDLMDIRELWSETKKEFEDLQKQLMNDLNNLGSLVEEMSNPARGYRKVIQENRKLYNMVQDLKGSIRVHCRIRPMFNAEAKSVVSFCEEDGTLIVLDPSKPQTEGRKVYQFNHVYGPMATQDEVFKDAQPVVRSVMDGYNVCILAYGQTGSGKTYTMYGASGVSEKEMGINFFAINGLFRTVGMRKNIITYELHLQMVEICNEQVRDLLTQVSACQDESSLSDVTSYAIKSNTEAINLVKQGEVRRISHNSREGTSLNSCSHSVVTIHVQGKDLSGNILRSCLHLVDLAGNGENNNSLSCLEDAITSLSQKHSSIHHSDSKLTSLLQDAFGGKAKVLVFAHVIAEGDGFTKTVGTLNFAQKISTIELRAAQSNKINSEVTELKNEILTLKSALGDKTISSPHPCKQLKSPCDKPRIVSQRTPVKSRRLSMENQGKLSKSPVGTQKIMTERTPPHSLRTSVENQSARKTDTVRNAGYRRLSIENPVIVRSEKTNKTPDEGKKGVTKLTPPRTRQLSIEKSSSVKPDIDNNGTKASCRIRRLSLEGPKDRTKETLYHTDVKVNSNSHISPSYLNGPIFTDCAEAYPPKTPEQPNHNLKHVIHSRVDISTDFQTPGTAKSAYSKGSQIKKSLRTIGKLINGSEKRNKNKRESTSTKVKELGNVAKSPPLSKTRVVRRQSLTNIPPPGITRRTSLEGVSTDTRPQGNRNAITPPSVRSSTNTAKRWM